MATESILLDTLRVSTRYADELMEVMILGLIIFKNNDFKSLFYEEKDSCGFFITKKE